MRIGVWNCRQGLDDKIDWLDELNCDVIVVRECARDSELSQQPGVDSLWKGEYEVRGSATMTPTTKRTDHERVTSRTYGASRLRPRALRPGIAAIPSAPARRQEARSRGGGSHARSG